MKIGDFWNRIKQELRKKAVTQESAATAIGLPYGTFRGWISKNRIPPLNYAYSLARYLGVSLDYLITGKENNKNTVILKEALHTLKELSNRINKSS